MPARAHDEGRLGPAGEALESVLRGRGALDRVLQPLRITGHLRLEGRSPTLVDHDCGHGHQHTARDADSLGPLPEPQGKAATATRDREQRPIGRRIGVGSLLAGDFAQNGDLGQVRPDIVVQIQCDPRPHVRQFEHTRHPVAVGDDVGCTLDQEAGAGEEVLQEVGEVMNAVGPGHHDAERGRPAKRIQQDPGHRTEFLEPVRVRDKGHLFHESALYR